MRLPLTYDMSAPNITQRQIDELVNNYDAFNAYDGYYKEDDFYTSDDEYEEDDY